MQIELEDAKAMVRLLGDTAACAGGHQEKKQFLMKGLAGLIDADAWLWTLSCKANPEDQMVHVGFVHGGMSDERFAHYLKALDHPAISEASKPFYERLTETQQHTTALRCDVDPEGMVYQSDAQALWELAELDDMVLSCYPLDENSLSALGFYRKPGAMPFSQREKMIAHVVLSEVSWLHMSGWPEDRGAKVPHLPPKLRMVLNLLIEGMVRKQIANHLEISPHTLSGYVKEVYKHFNVCSQTELMRKFLIGCGNE